MTTVVLLIHAGATCAMTGLIWFVQVVHYPLFDAVGVAGFPAYERAHAARTTLVVAPLMVVELLTAAWLALGAGEMSPFVNNGAGPFRPDPVRCRGQAVAWVGLALLAVIWVSTFARQVPLHDALARGFVAGTHAALVRSNWVRTTAWSVRSVLALWLLRLAT